MTSQAGNSVNWTGNTLVAGGDINTTFVTQYGSASQAQLEGREQQATDWLFKIASVNHYMIQSESYAKVTPGTADWILREPKFVTWLAAESGKFWGVGIPGAGKTILTSYVVNHLQKHSPADEHILFAYCRYDDSLTVSRLLAALLEQLCKQAPAASLLLLEKLYHPCAESEKRPPTENELTNFLQSTLTKISKKIRIIIDALDELRDSVREKLVGILVSLAVPIFVTSRVISIDGLESSDVHIHARAEDLRAFIVSEVGSLPKLSRLLKKRQDVREELIQSITVKADGMFLLASLQLSALEGTTSITNFRKAISALPTKLDDMYKVTLKRILDQSEEESSLACRAILLITHAYCPLSVPELLNALLVEPEVSTNELDIDALADEETLISVCCGLLTIEGEAGIVRLIHYTTHNFFLCWKDGLFKMPHSFLTDTCALYLQLSGFYAKLPSKYRELIVLNYKHSFAKYAFNHLGYHAAHSTAELDGELPSWAQSMIAQKQIIPLVHLKHLNDDPVHYGGIGHFAALHGLLSIMKALDLSHLTSNSLNGYTVLQYACIGGHVDIVKLLLNVEGPCSDVNALYGSSQETCLHLASQRDQGAVVKLLLGVSGIGVNTQDKGNNTPLHLASKYGSKSVVPLLLGFSGININAQNSHKNTPLHLASEYGRAPIVRLLLGFSGINIAMQNFDDSTPLHLASDHGYKAVVQLLLAFSGIDVDARDKDDNTSLHLASRKGYKAVVRLLLGSSGIDVNAQNGFKSTPLHLASRNGQVGVVQPLLGFSGIDVNAQNDENDTPLHLASAFGHEAVVQLLLGSSEIDVNAQNDGNKNLLWASKPHHKPVAKLLLGFTGIDISVHAPDGHTPLHLASKNGHKAVVQQLLEHPQIDINRVTVQYGLDTLPTSTPLDLAIHEGHQAVAKLLQEQGAKCARDL